MSYGLSYKGITEDGILQYQIRSPVSEYNLSNAKIIFGISPICIRWNQEMQLEFTSDESSAE